MIGRAMAVLGGMITALVVTPPAAGSAAVSTAPVYSTSYTVAGIGSGSATGTATGFNFRASSSGVVANLDLPANSPAASTFVQAANQGTHPTSATFAIAASGVELVDLVLANPVLSVTQDATPSGLTENVTFRSGSYSWNVRNSWQPTLATPAGELDITPTSTSGTDTVQVIGASLAMSASPATATFSTQEPFSSNASLAVAHSFISHAALASLALAPYELGTATSPVTDSASSVQVLGFGETVSPSSFDDNVLFGSAAAAMTVTQPLHPAVTAPGVLHLGATATTPAMSIKLASVSAAIVGGPTLITSEPLDTAVSPNLVKLVGVALPSATLTLYDRGGGTQAAATYTLTGVELLHYRTGTSLNDQATFGFTLGSWKLPSHTQIPPQTPAGTITVPSSPPVTATASVIDVKLIRSSTSGSAAAKVTVTEPADKDVSKVLLQAVKSRVKVPTLILSVYQPKTTIVAATYKLTAVRVPGITESGSSGPVEDKFTLVPTTLSVSAPSTWHPRPAPAIGTLHVADPATSATEYLSGGELDTATTGVTVKTSEPFDSTMTPLVMNSLLGAGPLSTVSATWYTPRTPADSVSYATSAPAVLSFDETAYDGTLVDVVKWSFPAVSVTPGSWQGAVAKPVGSLFMVTPPQTTTVPVETASMAATTDLVTTLDLPFDSTLSPYFLQAAVTGGATTASGQLSVYGPGTQTATEVFGISSPSFGLTETAGAQGIVDKVRMTATNWSFS